MGDTVISERKGRISIIKLNRPHVLNAVNDELVEDLIKALAKARGDPKTRVIILKGEGKAFCAGADLKDQVSARTLEQYRDHVIRIQELPFIITHSHSPRYRSFASISVSSPETVVCPHAWHTHSLCSKLIEWISAPPSTFRTVFRTSSPQCMQFIVRPISTGFPSLMIGPLFAMPSLVKGNNPVFRRQNTYLVCPVLSTTGHAMEKDYCFPLTGNLIV